MKRALALMGISLALGRGVRASPRNEGPAPPDTIRSAPSSRPEPTLPMLPSVSRVRIEAARDRVVIVEDIDLPRGEWQSGGLDLYAAFGAPGPPVAVDAYLVGLIPVERDRHAYGPEDRIAIRTAPRRTPGALVLLGRPLMAGVALHVTDGQLRRAYASGDRAVLRIRTLLRPPATDSSGARDVVVRLGTADGLPMTLDRIQIASLDATMRIARAEATLCGPEADPWPLSIMGAAVPRDPAQAPSRPAPAPVSPSAAVRHASDDLCVRWWVDEHR